MKYLVVILETLNFFPIFSKIFAVLFGMSFMSIVYFAFQDPYFILIGVPLLLMSISLLICALFLYKNNKKIDSENTIELMNEIHMKLNDMYRLRDTFKNSTPSLFQRIKFNILRIEIVDILITINVKLKFFDVKYLELIAHDYIDLKDSDQCLIRLKNSIDSLNEVIKIK